MCFSYDSFDQLTVKKRSTALKPLELQGRNVSRRCLKSKDQTWAKCPLYMINTLSQHNDKSKSFN